MAGHPGPPLGHDRPGRDQPALHAYPALGNRQLGALRRSDIQGWVKDLSRALAPGSVELIYRWVSTIFKAAVGDRLIASSPCVGINVPKRNDAEVVPLNVSEVEAMAAAVPERYPDLIVFAAGMGLRQGECFGLTADRVDFLRRQVGVDRQLISASGAFPEFKPPKSKAGFGTVPLPDVVGTALAAHLARYRPGRFGLVFTSGTGNPLRRNTACHMWHAPAPGPGCRPGPPSTTGGTSTPPCSSTGDAPSRRSSAASATSRPWRPSTPTATYGPTATTRPATPSTTSSRA